MRICYNKTIYSKAALLKAAYHFTNDYYIYLDQNNDEYIVEIDAKNGLNNSNIKGKFSNELLAQVTREEIFKQTSHIRELVLGRAFASTIIEINNETETSIEDKLEQFKDGIDFVSSDSIFKDWYDNNESRRNVT